MIIFVKNLFFTWHFTTLHELYPFCPSKWPWELSETMLTVSYPTQLSSQSQNACLQCSATVVLNREISPTPRRHLTMFGDNWGMLLASSEQRPGVLLKSDDAEDSPPQIIIWPQMSPVPRLRNPDFTRNLMFFPPDTQMRHLINTGKTYNL